MDIKKACLIVIGLFPLFGHGQPSVVPLDRGISVDEWNHLSKTPSHGLAQIIDWKPSDYDSNMAYWLAHAYARYQLSDYKRFLKHLPKGNWSYVPEDFTVQNIRCDELHKTVSFFSYSFPQNPQLDDSRYAVFMYYRSKEKPMDATNFIFALYVNLNTGAVDLCPDSPNNLYGMDGKMFFPLLLPDIEKVQRTFVNKFRQPKGPQ